MKQLFFILLSCFILQACKNNSAAEKVDNTSANTTQNTYQWDKHNDFDIFYADFKTAVNNKDKESVYKMMQIPFLCNAMECDALNRESGESYDKSKDLSINNKEEFNAKYDILFSDFRVKDINRAAFNSLDKFEADDEMAKEFYMKDEMVLLSRYEKDGIDSMDLFSFKKDINQHYKLTEIPYRP